jgi:hypothetical protein
MKEPTMPLPPAPREIERLTEGWPGEPGDSELSAFAATFRADRPELSAPALDRIGGQLRRELARLERRDALRRSMALRFRRLAPLAAAAAVLVGVGMWLHLRPGASPRTGEDPSGLHSVPVIQAHPSAPGEGAAPAPPTSKPVVN